MRSYYNTNHIEGVDLIEAINLNDSQEKKVAVLFRSNPGKLLTAEFINETILKGAHRGTVSRALRNLVLQDVIEKTENYSNSKCSKKVHTWRLKVDLSEYVQKGLF